MLLVVAQTENGSEEVRNSPGNGKQAKRTGTSEGASARGAQVRGPQRVEFCGRSECGWLRNDRDPDCRAIKGIGKLGEPDDEAT